MIPKTAAEVQDMVFKVTPEQARNEIQSKLYGEQKEEDTDKRIKRFKAIEGEIFKILEAFGYVREDVLPIVANFMENLNRSRAPK